jgi:hypothetical protein
MPKIKKRKEKESSLKCCYCKQYFNCSITRSTGDRFCSIGNKDITDQSNACENFTKGSYFYCRKRNGQVDTFACYHIRRTKQLYCGSKNHKPDAFAKVYEMCHQKCEQGRQIEKMMEYLDLIHGTISFIPYIEVKPKITINRRTKIKRRR